MSDGPHRSLPMGRGWKRVAMRGDKSAFATDEISAALIPALQQDCNAEASPTFLDRLVKACREQDHSLFKNDLAPQLETLRASAGAGIGRVILDEAIRAAAGGEQGLNVAIVGVHNAFIDRAARGARHVEEHYFRESTAPRAHHVRERIDQAIGISEVAINDLARRVLKLDTSGAARQPVKQQDLDDGVRL